MMTDNKLWDTIINPNAKVEIIESKSGSLRGIKISMKFNKETSGLDIDKEVMVEVTDFDDVGTNYKKARQDMVKEVRKIDEIKLLR